MGIGPSSPKGKPAPKPAESKPEPPEYKTVLKVSSLCACDGCKRKPNKILTIKGVHTVDIDWGEQKVTVKGSVDSVTLIKEFKKKTGKHAELWPQEGDQKEKKQRKGKSEQKSSGEYDNSTMAVILGEPKSALKKRRPKRGSNPKSSREESVQKQKNQGKPKKKVQFFDV